MSSQPQTYLITPPIADPDAFAPVLSAALARLKPACVLLRFDENDERSLIKSLKRLAPLVQEAGAAALVEDNPTAAIRGGADGVHVTRGIGALREALEALKPDRIVGIGRLRGRHDAMEAGETGVDYIMFGEARADGYHPDLAHVIDLAHWWASLFEVPCVAVAADAASVLALGETGAEFIGQEAWAFAEK